MWALEFYFILEQAQSTYCSCRWLYHRCIQQPSAYEQLMATRLLNAMLCIDGYDRLWADHGIRIVRYDPKQDGGSNSSNSYPYTPMGMLGIYHLLLVSLFLCPQTFRNSYLQHGLTHSDEIWQDGRSGWVAGHLLFWWTLAQGLAPQGQKVKCIGQSQARCDELAGDDAASG